ncbi:hypothetical protein Trco_000386 [Trichoderma cornu-damae]|uniref:DRBM domain-containing protein n=1 Tax=Trichoderma cornu-damae TaxID=654480 RepID=A0A9P8QS74_9HYPO|nr:hypothetical protein Trco_000386 [Trichoderma cornu-damae]
MGRDNKQGVPVPVPVPVPWDRLKAWIEAQEVGEQLGHPSITKEQAAALSRLVDFLDGPEPDVSDRDYVSLLMHQAQHRNFHHHYQELEPVDVPVDGVFSLRWRTVCFLTYADKGFPCLGHGLYQGQDPPLFKSKKMSKQYAAKYALAYIHSHPPPGNASSIAPTPASGGAPLGPVPGGGSDAGISPSPSAPLPGGVPVASPSPSPSTTPESGFYADGRLPSVLEQVSLEANRLNFGCPKYDIGPDPNQPGCFAGKPIFPNGGRIPPNLGYVSGVSTKGQAKELIAEELLRFFKDQFKIRQDIVASFREPGDSPVENE